MSNQADTFIFTLYPYGLSIQNNIYIYSLPNSMLTKKAVNIIE